MKYLVLVCDRPEHSDHDLLESADKPVIDRLARYSLCGSAMLVPADAQPGVASECLAVLSYDPEKYSYDPARSNGANNSEAQVDEGFDSGSLPGFKLKNKRIAAAAFSDSETVLGIAHDAGFTTGAQENDLRALAVSAADAFDAGNELVYIHVAKDQTEGEEVLAEADRFILSPLYEKFRREHGSYSILFVYASSVPGVYSPFFIYSSEKKISGTRTFNEKRTAECDAQLPDGYKLTELLVHGRLPEYGIGPSGVRSAVEIFELIAVSLVCVMLIMTFIARHSPVIGSSMENTLQENDILLIADNYISLETGDIVIIQHDSQPEEPLVKRVIAVGGQTLRIDYINWEITVDGEVIDSSYVNRVEGASMRSFGNAKPDATGIWEGVVPEGTIFVMGDNRNNSKDSRSLGFMDVRYVIGKVKYRILPLSKFSEF